MDMSVVKALENHQHLPTEHLEEKLNNLTAKELAKLINGLNDLKTPYIHCYLREVTANTKDFDMRWDTDLSFVASVPGVVPVSLSARSGMRVSGTPKRTLVEVAARFLTMLLHLPELAVFTLRKAEFLECRVSVFEASDITEVLPGAVPIKHSRHQILVPETGVTCKIAYARADGWLAVAHIHEVSFSKEPVEECSLAMPVLPDEPEWPYSIRWSSYPPPHMLSAAVEVLTARYIRPDRYRDSKPAFTLVVCPLLGSPFCLRGCPHECESRREELPYYAILEATVQEFLKKISPNPEVIP